MRWKVLAVIIIITMTKGEGNWGYLYPEGDNTQGLEEQDVRKPPSGSPPHPKMGSSMSTMLVFKGASVVNTSKG